MGREIKRVPMDFNWPMGETWFGYTESIGCQLCEGENKECLLCYGENMIPVSIDPPKGDGWQMWETTSEGSPMSPVCETPEKLAQWLVDNNASSFGHMTASYEEWLGMINAGWSVSAVMDGKTGELMSGVEFAAKNEK